MELDAAILSGFAKVGFIAIGGLGLVILYYTSVASFAYTLFPYLPSAKGGGNYSSSPAISVYIDHPTLLKNPAFVPFEGRLENMVLIYSTSTSFYFGVCDWRKTEEIKAKGPAPILQIKRDEIKYLAVNASGPIPKVIDCTLSTPPKPTSSSTPPPVPPQPPSGTVKDKL
jgi:hypothetical protein